MGAPSRRGTTEIFTKAGGVFWGLVFLIVGMIWLLAALDVIQANLEIVLPLVVILAGIYLLVTKLFGSPFPPGR